MESEYGDFGPAERDGERVPGEAGGDPGQQGESPRRPAVADCGGGVEKKDAAGGEGA